MEVKGFPTLKTVRPGKKPGRPIVQEYQGERTANAIVESIIDKIPNHVKRLTNKDIEDWLKKDNDTAKAILFTEKGTTSALLRALAIDYLGSIRISQVRNREKQIVETFGISSYPTFVLLPGGDKDSIVYDGELKKDAMSEFLKQVAAPNPDPAPEDPKKKKSEKKAGKKADKKAKKENVETQDPKDSDDSSESPDDEPPSPPPPPPPPKRTPPLSLLPSKNELEKRCLTTKSRICILIFVPPKGDAIMPYPIEVMEALKNLADVHEKHSRRRSLFPFYVVPVDNPMTPRLREELNLKSGDEMEIIAVNARRRWWRQYPGSDYTLADIEDWVDAIRMNEGKRERLPASLVTDVEDEDEEEETIEESLKKAAKKEEEKAAKKEQAEPVIEHSEL
jgi:protein disulfide-isomerase A6